MSPTSLLRGIAFLLLLQWVSTLIINALGVPFPPALLGMLILTALLCGNVIPASSIEGIFPKWVCCFYRQASALYYM